MGTPTITSFDIKIRKLIQLWTDNSDYTYLDIMTAGDKTEYYLLFLLCLFGPYFLLCYKYDKKIHKKKRKYKISYNSVLWGIGLSLLPFIISLTDSSNNYQLTLFGYIYICIDIIILFLLYSIKETDSPKEIYYLSNYSNEELNDFISNSVIYKESLVNACKEELKRRQLSEAQIPQVKEMSDENIRNRISNPQNFNDVIQEEMKKRNQIQAEEQRKKEEKIRLQKEEETRKKLIQRHQKRKKTIESLKKKAPFIIALFIVIAILSILLYILSDSNKYRLGMKYYKNKETDKCIEKLSQITDTDFSRYTEAQYMLYTLYLSEKGDSANAAKSLKAAVINRNWNYEDAYTTYVSYLLNGEFEPYIKKDEIKSAQYLSNSKEESDKITAGILYLNNTEYKKAYDIFSSLPENKFAKGYMGIFYLYGFNGKRSYPEIAYKYIIEAPDELPFVVYKGDLTLFLKKTNNRAYNNDIIHCIEIANKYYGYAVKLDPENKAYQDRLKITNHIIQARYEPFATRTWYSYNFENGFYNGEYESWDRFAGAHGWGCFQFNDNELNLGHFYRCINSGLGMKIIPKNNNGFSIEIGNFVDGSLYKGSYYSQDGKIITGTFNIKNTDSYELINGISSYFKSKVDYNPWLY